MKAQIVVLASVGMVASSFGQIAYDSLFSDLAQTTTWTATNTGSTPRGIKGDVITLPALTGTNTRYSLSQMRLGLVNSGTTTFTGALSYNIRIFSTATTGTSTTTPVFSNQILNATINIASLSLAANSFSIRTVTFGSPVDLIPTSLSSPTFGVQITTLVGGVAFDQVSPLLTTMPTGSAFTVGSSTNGWYRDVSNNGTLEQSELRTFANVDSNLAMSLTAAPVPEPATMAAVAVGAFGLLRRRRK